ncbi:hypothetical protein BRARA_H02923 [Brassica rapa]|uniref:Uncharacterized protein n=1 Tax=Brassica campestris TaxID=3711 RepID=A0A397YNC8_BRACM|nr:hypothetical protein BRARA_H02923 [Brassica rapa]
MTKPLHPSYELETSRSTMNSHRHISNLLENIYGFTKTTGNLKPPTIDSSPPRRDVGDRDRDSTAFFNYCNKKKTQKNWYG